MAVGHQVLRVQRFIEVVENVARIGERLKASAFEQQVLVTAPALALDQIIVQRPVFVGVLQVQRARFDAVLNM